jgi:DNA end-binding protein Ku
MPQAIWSGAISLGLLNVPVRMYSAIDEQDLHFHYLHRKDGSRIGFEKVCKKEGKAVPDDELVKAYQVSERKYVQLEDEDFKVAEGRAHRTIELSSFVPYEEIDPIYFERTYYLGPDDGAEKVYTLLVKAMERSGLAGIGTYVMRNRQQLGCLRIRDGVVTLEKMYFADEIRPVDDVPVERVRIGKGELDLASELIERLSGSFDIGDYRDEYRQALLKVIDAKRRGKAVEVEAEPEPAEAPDLMEALKASLDARRGRARAHKERSTRSSARKPPRARGRTASRK